MPDDELSQITLLHEEFYLPHEHGSTTRTIELIQRPGNSVGEWHARSFDAYGSGGGFGVNFYRRDEEEARHWIAGQLTKAHADVEQAQEEMRKLAEASDARA
jgi:hypothetical protein